MKTLIFFGLLIIIVFGGSVKLFSRIKTISPFKYIFFSGTIYLLFGLLIGGNGFKLVSEEIITHLSPILHFSLGWVGFIFGFQFEMRFLKRIPIYKYFVFLLTYSLSFFTLFVFSFFTLRLFFFGLLENNRLLLGTAIILSFLLTESSVSFVTWSSKLFKKNFTEFKVCAFISTMNNLIPVLFTGIIFSFYSFSYADKEIKLNNLGHSIKHLLLQLAIAAFFGVLIYFLQRKIEDRLDISVILFGSIFMMSGLSFMYDLSPLFISMFAGVLFANLTKKHHLILNIINSTEKPIYLFFILLLSLKTVYFSLIMVLFVLILLLIKYYSVFFTFKVVNKIKPESFFMPPEFSIFLVPVSSIGPAILLDMSLVYPVQNTSVLTGIFILGLLIAEILSPLGVNLMQKRENG